MDSITALMIFGILYVVGNILVFAIALKKENIVLFASVYVPSTILLMAWGAFVDLSK